MAGIIKVDRVQSDNNLAFQVAGANVAYFDSTDGIKAPLVTTNGIKFPAAQVSSSDANTLDDYEEGTWTPVDYFGVVTFSQIASARYVKIGRMVYLSADFTIASTSSANSMYVAGLPFTMTNGVYSTFAVGYNTTSKDVNAVIGSINGLEFYGGSSATNSTVWSAVAAGRIIISGWYLATA